MSASPITSGNTNAEAEALHAVGLSCSLTVKDIQKSLAWYRDVVGFVVDQPYERDGQLRGVALKAGAVRILLNVDDGGEGLGPREGRGVLAAVHDVTARRRRRGPASRSAAALSNPSRLTCRGARVCSACTTPTATSSRSRRPGLSTLITPLAAPRRLHASRPDNPVVALCAEGMAVEGDREQARALFTRAWAIHRDDYEASIAAHFLARHQTTSQRNARLERAGTPTRDDGHRRTHDRVSPRCT